MSRLRILTRNLAIISLLAAVMSVVTAASAQEREPPTAAIIHTVRAILEQSQSAGVVVVPDQRTPDRGLGPIFSLRDEANRTAVLPALKGTARDLLARHASSERALSAKGATLIDKRATACTSLLRTKIDSEYKGGLRHVVNAVLNEALGRPPQAEGAGGAIGVDSCEWNSGARTGSITVVGARTLLEVLQAAVEQAPGTAWLMVEASGNRCAVGLIVAAEGGGDACVLQFGSSLAR